MDNQSEEYHFSFDTSTDLTVDVIQAVSAATDTDPLSGPPLTEAVDVDALARLLSGPRPVSVTFRYADCEVHVDGDGTLQVRSVAESAR